MKKLLITLFSTLVLTGTVGTNMGCSSGGGSGGSGGDGGTANGIVLVPNADGFFDGTQAGILGAWYSYGDWYGNAADPSMPIAGMGDCPVKGGYTAAQCSSIAMPTPGTPFSNTGGTMCTMGTVAKVVDMAYSAIWGAGIGFDLNNAGNDGGTGIKGAWDASAHGITGFSFHIDMPPTGGQMRVEFPTNDIPGTTDINSAYWGGASNLSPIKNGGDYSFKFSEVSGPMYSTSPPPFMPSKIISMQFHVVANTSSTIDFNYCISKLTALTN